MLLDGLHRQPKKKENKDEQRNVKENHIDGQESVRH